MVSVDKASAELAAVPPLAEDAASDRAGGASAAVSRGRIDVMKWTGQICPSHWTLPELLGERLL